LSVLSELENFDANDIFAQPVRPSQAYNYFSFIGRPMDFATWKRNLTAPAGGAAPAAKSARYATVQAAYEDLQRIFLNCMHYNQEIDDHQGSLAKLAKDLLALAQKRLREVLGAGGGAKKT